MKGLAFNHLVQALHQQLASLPDYRQGKNTRYAIKDAALGAFAVFFTQSPSFLAYQRTMQQAKGRSNAESLFGMGDLPCDNQIRTLLDPVAPAQLFPCLPRCMPPWKRRGSCHRGGLRGPAADRPGWHRIFCVQGDSLCALFPSAPMPMGR